jgi:ABC-type transport system substrate-binding protein
MDDVRVRKAFNHAVDKAALARLKKSSKVLTGLFPKASSRAIRIPQGDPFDVKRARALLAEAGFRDARATTIPRSFLRASRCSTTRPESNRVTAEFMQAQWRQNLGITIQLRKHGVPHLPSASATVANTRGSRALAGWGDYMDPVTFLDLVLHARRQQRHRLVHARIREDAVGCETASRIRHSGMKSSRAPSGISWTPSLHSSAHRRH